MEDLFAFIEDETDRRLAEALSGLMEKEAFDQITTSQIISVSGVSRSTFYRRYKDKYDLLNKLYQWILDDTIMKVPHGFSFKKAFYELYRTLQSYPRFFKNALASAESNSLRSYIFQKSYEMYEQILQSEGIDTGQSYYQMLLTGFISGALEVTCKWAEKGMKEDLDQLFMITFELTPHEIQRIIALKF